MVLDGGRGFMLSTLVRMGFEISMESDSPTLVYDITVPFFNTSLLCCAL